MGVNRVGRLGTYSPTTLATITIPILNVIGVNVSKVGHYGGYSTNPYQNVIGEISPNELPYTPPSNVINYNSIPNVTNQSANQAIVQLGAIGLNYSFQYQITNNPVYQQYNAQGGYVFAQTPPAGNQPTNSVLLLTYQYLANSTVVPYVIGESLTTATATLSAANLTVTLLPYIPTIKQSFDQIVQIQSIAPNTTVSAGTTIGLSYTKYVGS